jgi:dienelactone hydrolase
MYGTAAAGNRERIMAAVLGLRDDPELLVRRARAGLSILAGERHVAVGFCFGGMAALTLARAGVPLAGAVSVHGTLASTAPAPACGTVTARLLVCHGADDPHVPFAQVTEFGAAMTAAGADWQVNLYGGAGHGFTHRDTEDYRAEADRRSFTAISHLLSETMDG